MFFRIRARAALCVALLSTAACEAAPPVIALAPPRDPAATVEAARTFHEALRESDASLLWSHFSFSMKVAVGPKPRFERTLRRIVSEVGRLEGCSSEIAARRDSSWIYRAECRFSKFPARLVIGFDPDGMIDELRINTIRASQAIDRSGYETKARLELPFHGEWWVFWGGRTPQLNYHVTSRDQRYAYDFVVLRGAKSYWDRGRSNTEHYCFGLPIVAPAAGKIVWLSDGVHDNRPGKINAKEPLGNAVVIDHGNGEFSVMAHFKRGSLTVERGEEVDAGTQLGRCGNSGQSMAPHLHYHLQDGPVPFAGDGLPAFFHDYLADGEPVAKGEPIRRQSVSRIGE